MSPSRRSMARALTLGVLATMAIAVIAAVVGTRQIVSQQEQRLLKQRTDELSVYVSGVTQVTGAQLSEIATFARVYPNPEAGFLEGTEAVPATPTTRVRALLRGEGDGSFRVLAAAGSGLAAGQMIQDPTVAAAATQARRATSFVLTPLEPFGKKKLVTLVQGKGAPAGDVVIQQQVVNPQPSSASSGPYSELYVALYDGTRAIPSQLTIANGPLSAFGGTTAREITHLGSSPFLVVTAARSTLVGGVALNAQWLILGLGLGLTLLLGILFDASQRRRNYALDLVEERTAALNESLETLRRTQDQLVHSERLAAIGQLASTVGHELRNPLAVISNALYLLRRETASSEDPRIAQHLSTADREVSAATLIVSDLLEFSRGREPMIENVDVGDLVDEALSVAPHPDGVEVDWPAPDKPVWARADRDQLRQVVLNLLTNSYDAMPAGGSLRIRTEADGPGQVGIEVSDTGMGMDEETTGRIFEPFFTTKARGVGLGLAVTHRILAAHGGTIEVRSAPGQGTTFSLRLPAAERPT